MGKRTDFGFVIGYNSNTICPRYATGVYGCIVCTVYYTVVKFIKTQSVKFFNARSDNDWVMLCFKDTFRLAGVLL